MRVFPDDEKDFCAGIDILSPSVENRWHWKDSKSIVGNYLLLGDPAFPERAKTRKRYPGNSLL